MSYTRGSHAFKAGFEARINRDTTYFGISPNGEYDFGGGTAYATTKHQLRRAGRTTFTSAIRCPIPSPASLPASPFVYTVAIAPPFHPAAQHIGPAAINRKNYNAWIQDTWKITPRLTLDYGVRWELYTPITERAHRTGRFRDVNGHTAISVINPQPATRPTGTDGGRAFRWHGRRPAKSGARRRGVTVIPPNIWQDNFLTGSTPFVMYPATRFVGTRADQLRIPDHAVQLPHVYTPDGTEHVRNGQSQSSSVEHGDGCGPLRARTLRR